MIDVCKSCRFNSGFDGFDIICARSKGTPCIKYSNWQPKQAEKVDNPKLLGKELPMPNNNGCHALTHHELREIVQRLSTLEADRFTVDGLSMQADINDQVLERLAKLERCEKLLPLLEAIKELLRHKFGKCERLDEVKTELAKLKG